MNYYNDRKICDCGFITFSKKAWREHLKQHGQMVLK